MQSEKTKKTRLGLKALIPAAAGVAAVILIIVFATLSQNGLPTVVIKGNELKVEVATTSQEKERGLCCRDSLAKDQGMLFAYSREGQTPPFWMKDTRIPLDMIWLDRNKTVVHIEENVQPQSYPQRYSSPVPAQYVLETNAGYSATHHITVGDSVQFEL